jgi:hypothetical protein
MTDEQASEQVDNKFEEILRAIIAELHSRNSKDRVSVALFFLLVREANTWRSIRLLRKHTPEQFHTAFMVDAGTLLRAMFDASLQADFIFCDPATRIERATQYLDFEHVERYVMVQKVLRHENQLANTLKSSPLRPDGEKRVQEAYDRVKDQFLLVEKKKCNGNGKHAARTRDKWYKGGLFQLAEAAGKVAEYDTFVASFSGCVHSSAFAVRKGPVSPIEHVLVLSSKFAARVAKLNVEYNQLELGEDRLILEELCKSSLDK